MHINIFQLPPQNDRTFKITFISEYVFSWKFSIAYFVPVYPVLYMDKCYFTFKHTQALKLFPYSTCFAF